MSSKCKIKHGGPLGEKFCAVPCNNCVVCRRCEKVERISQKGRFRSVRTSDDVENSATPFCRARADRIAIGWSTAQIYKCMVLEEKAEAK